MIRFFDTHTHLNDSAFEKDRDLVVAAAQDSGVGLMAEIACVPEDWPRLEDLCLKYPQNIIGVCGIHPQNADLYSEESRNLLKEYLKKPFVKALGEIGLDYARYYHPRERQIEVLNLLIQTANESGAPLVLHCRDNDSSDMNAYDDIFASLGKYWNPGSKKAFSGIFHCFAGNRADAFKAVDMGLLIAVNGTFTYPKNYELRDIIKAAGAKNIVFETDCPYLSPQIVRGKRNSPENIPEIAKAAAQFMGLKPEALAELVLHNSKQVYGL